MCEGRRPKDVCGRLEAPCVAVGKWAWSRLGRSHESRRLEFVEKVKLRVGSKHAGPVAPQTRRELLAHEPVGAQPLEQTRLPVWRRRSRPPKACQTFERDGTAARYRLVNGLIGRRPMKGAVLGRCRGRDPPTNEWAPTCVGGHRLAGTNDALMASPSRRRRRPHFSRVFCARPVRSRSADNGGGRSSSDSDNQVMKQFEISVSRAQSLRGEPPPSGAGGCRRDKLAGAHLSHRQGTPATEPVT